MFNSLSFTSVESKKLKAHQGQFTIINYLYLTFFLGPFQTFQAEIRNKSCWFIGGIEGTKFFLLKFPDLQPPTGHYWRKPHYIQSSKADGNMPFHQFLIQLQVENMSIKAPNSCWGSQQELFFLIDTMGKHYFLRSLLNLKVADIRQSIKLPFPRFRIPLQSKYWILTN